MLTLWILWVAFGILVVAMVTGPYRWAVALRSFVARAWHWVTGPLSGERRAQSVAWASSHAGVLQLGGAVVAGILFLIVSVSWLSFLIVGGLLAAYEIALQVIKVPPADGPPSAPASRESDLASPVGDT